MPAKKKERHRACSHGTECVGRSCVENLRAEAACRTWETLPAVLVSGVYADRNYWAGAGRQDNVVPHFDQGQRKREKRPSDSRRHRKVPEPRLQELAKLYNPKKITN